MRNRFLLPLFLCLFAALSGYAQIATLIDSSVIHGKLFSDGATLYEVHNDTLSSVNTTTGSRSMVLQMPPSANPSYWGNAYNIMGGTAYITTYSATNALSANNYKIWSYTGSGWDTILAPYYSWSPVSSVTNLAVCPVQIGTDYVYAFTRTDTNSSGAATAYRVAFVKTDGTNAGTQVIFNNTYPNPAVGSYFELIYPIYPYGGTDKSFFYIGHNDYDTPSITRVSLGVIDVNGVRIIDSGRNIIRLLGAVGNDVVYAQGLQTVGTYAINRYNVSTQVTTNLVPSTTSIYGPGVGFKNKFICSKTIYSPTGPTTYSLLSIDPTTGAETILVDTLSSSFQEVDISESLLSKSHLFIPTGSSSAGIYMHKTPFLFLSDGITHMNRPSVYFPRSLGQNGFGFGRSKFEISNGGLCNDEIYFSKGYITIIRQKLFKLTGANTADSQFNCAFPVNFVKVNGETYFLARYTYPDSTISYTRFLWKITSCSEPAAVSNPQIAAAQATVYPNPAQTEITISLPGTNTSATLALYDATGRLVLSQIVKQQQAVSIHSLPNGLYIYHLTAPNGLPLGSNRLSILH